MAAEDNEGFSSLYLAVSSKHEAVVRLLLENGAKSSFSNATGYREIDLAVSKGYDAIVDLLAGREVRLKDFYNSRRKLRLTVTN